MVTSNIEYGKKLLEKLKDQGKWWEITNAYGKELNNLYIQVSTDIETSTVSGKIALILLQHQLCHDLLRDLISASTLYVQGEIWPTKFVPSYEGQNDRTTGWYITYYEEHCIDCKGKNEFISTFRELNKIRNNVAHKLIGKNDVIINQSYKEFLKISKKVLQNYSVCSGDIHKKLEALNLRVDFSEL